jgi:hypothetical protein
LFIYAALSAVGAKAEESVNLELALRLRVHILDETNIDAQGDSEVEANVGFQRLINIALPK